MDLTSLRRLADRVLSEYRHACKTVREEEGLLEEVKTLEQDTAQAQKVVQTVAQMVQEQAHDKISKIVSRCLGTVFDDPYDFKIIFEQKRGKTEARPVFYRNGEEVDPRDGAGGGVLDVAALGLQVGCLLLCNPPRRRLLVLDEPFKHLSRDDYDDGVDYASRIKKLLEALSQDLGIQFIIVTHWKAMRTGKVIEIHKGD